MFEESVFDISINMYLCLVSIEIRIKRGTKNSSSGFHFLLLDFLIFLFPLSLLSSFLFFEFFSIFSIRKKALFSKRKDMSRIQKLQPSFLPLSLSSFAPSLPQLLKNIFFSRSFFHLIKKCSKYRSVMTRGEIESCEQFFSPSFSFFLSLSM